MLVFLLVFLYTKQGEKGPTDTHQMAFAPQAEQADKHVLLGKTLLVPDKMICCLANPGGLQGTSQA